MQAVRRFSDKVGETVSGITDMHVNNTSRYEKALASNRLADIYRIRFDIYRKKFFIKFLNNFLAQLTPFFFYAIGGYLVIMGKLSLGALVAVLAAYKDLASPWKELLKFYQITEDTRVKYKQIIEQFQPGNMLNPDLQKGIDKAMDVSGSLDAASVSYSEDEFVKSIDSVSFTIQPGDHVCIMGMGGSGRGELTQLIARILKPSFGKIKLGDQDIAHLPETILGRHISYVDQQSYVFTGTIKENLLYGLKNEPQQEVEYIDDELKSRQTYIKDAALSANSQDDIQAGWIDLNLTANGDIENFNQHILNTLKIAGIEDDIYQLGLYSPIDESRHTELAQGILSARKRLREELLKPEYHELVEILDENRYNTNLNVAENLLFGMPVGPGLYIDSIMTDPTIQDAIEQAELKQPLLQIGLQTAKVMVDIFSDVPEGSPLFERFSFVSLDDLPELARLAKISDSAAQASLSETDVETLMGLAFKLNRSRHRLGLVTPEIQEKIIHAHALIKEKLGISNQLIEFYSQDKIARHLSIQDNILFGRVAYGQANAKQKVGNIIQEVINQLQLKRYIIEVGLDYFVGVSGARLNSAQRQKLTLARALIKNPEILVINEATSVLDHQVEKMLINNILKALPSKTIIWVISNKDYISNFDKLMILDKGKLVEYGAVEEVATRDQG